MKTNYMRTTHRINALQKCVTQDIKSQASARLDTTIYITVTIVRKGQVLFLNNEKRVAHSKLHHGELVNGCVYWKDISLRGRIVCCSGDGVVDFLASLIINKSNGGASVSNSLVVFACNHLPIHTSRGRREHPETPTVVHFSILNLLPGCLHSSIIDVAKCVERFNFIRLIGITPTAEFHSEQLVIPMISSWSILFSTGVFRTVARQC